MKPTPPDDAYGRVTDPERYRPLHRLADELLDRLTTEHAVDRAEGASLDEQLHARVPVERLVRLTPPAGAPLTVGFTPFPGLIVRYGRWHVEAYPACGCDACDEDLDDLAGQLTARAQSLVDGAFSEEVTVSGWLSYRFAESSAGRQRLSQADPARSEPGRRDWPPWPPAE